MHAHALPQVSATKEFASAAAAVYVHAGALIFIIIRNEYLFHFVALITHAHLREITPMQLFGLCMHALFGRK